MGVDVVDETVKELYHLLFFVLLFFILQQRLSVLRPIPPAFPPRPFIFFPTLECNTLIHTHTHTHTLLLSSSLIFVLVKFFSLKSKIPQKCWIGRKGKSKRRTELDRFNSNFKLTGDIFVRVSEWVSECGLLFCCLCLILLFSSLFLFFSFHLIVTDRCCFNYRWPKSNSKSKIQNQCGLSQNFKSLFFNFQSRDHEACYVIPRFCVALLTLLTLLIVNNTQTHTHTHTHTPTIVLKFLYVFIYLFFCLFSQFFSIDIFHSIELFSIEYSGAYLKLCSCSVDGLS